MDPVCGRCHVVDPVDGGHSVQGISCGLKDLNAIEEEYTGGQPGEQGVEEKGKTGQTDPAPAGSPAEQELFRKRYLEGYTAAELGKMYGLPPATVRTRLAKARRYLSQLLMEE